jgi:ComEC/Rec2-related protein
VQIKKAAVPGDTVAYGLPAEFYTAARGPFLGKTLFIKGRLRPSRLPYRPNMLTGRIIASDRSCSFAGALFERISAYIDGLFRSFFNPQDYDLASGLVLGGSGRVGNALRESFTRAGLLHILSVSGLHVGFVVSFISALLLFAPLSPKVKLVIVLIILFIYAGVTGFRPSVVRASLMAGLFGLALVSQRRVDGVHVLNVSALMLLIANPLILFDIGAQLSFTSVYGIVYLYPRWQPLFTNRVRPFILRQIISLMTVSLCAQLFVSPLLIQYFNRTQPVAVVSNLLIVPLTTIIVYLLFACILVSPVLLPAAKLLAATTSVLLAVLCALARFFSSLPFSSVTVSMSAPFAIMFFFLFVPRLRLAAIYAMLGFAVISSAAAFSPCLQARISRNACVLGLSSGQTLFYVAEGAVPPGAFQADHAGWNYFIGPPDQAVEAERWIGLPGPFQRKRVKLGDIRLELDPGLRVTYDRRTLDIVRDDALLDNDDVLYQLTNGQKFCSFKARDRGSLLDHVADDLRLLAIRVWLLF